ncbi:e91966c7-1ce9-4748-a7ce-4e8422e1ff72-CDS [Sclerotinia trifoliorum]|uniref:E91966c7-1ce9-4748-a7ce-4e8422e1ff72-CDS n=1 Tax=Sclerotinia trifoliorum TaxID=28548 RepID=A0A8H2ZUI1_9HELO|nr:e91966c7-1ce9-4748-a7ce-4e8422e1ff72-CDS [Sclerotinia trifoliorum]
MLAQAKYVARAISNADLIIATKLSSLFQREKLTKGYITEQDTILFSIRILIIASNAKRTLFWSPTYIDMPESANTIHMPAVVGHYSRDLTSLIDISRILGPIFPSIHVLSVNAIVVSRDFVAKIICYNT